MSAYGLLERMRVLLEDKTGLRYKPRQAPDLRWGLVLDTRQMRPPAARPLLFAVSEFSDGRISLDIREAMAYRDDAEVTRKLEELKRDVIMNYKVLAKTLYQISRRRGQITKMLQVEARRLPDEQKLKLVADCVDKLKPLIEVPKAQSPP
ncbi:MAG: hypothetical protein C4339_03780 [Nitrososphaerota archaeon]